MGGAKTGADRLRRSAHSSHLDPPAVTTPERPEPRLVEVGFDSRAGRSLDFHSNRSQALDVSISAEVGRVTEVLFELVEGGQW